jgi:hypothetical protein
MKKFAIFMMVALGMTAASCTQKSVEASDQDVETVDSISTVDTDTVDVDTLDVCPD